MLSAAPSTQWMAMISRVCERVSSEVLSTTWWSETRCTCSISRTSQLPTCWTNWQVSRPKRKSRDRKVAALSTLSQWQQFGEVWADSKLIDPQKTGLSSPLVGRRPIETQNLESGLIHKAGRTEHELALSLPSMLPSAHISASASGLYLFADQ